MVLRTLRTTVYVQCDTTKGFSSYVIHNYTMQFTIYIKKGETEKISTGDPKGERGAGRGVDEER